MSGLIVSAETLRGMPYERAVLMGMPHIRETFEDDSRKCAICGKRACQEHHMAPKGRGNKFLTLAEVKLESPIIDLCAGCHALFHAPKLYRIEWQWLDITVERQWWAGELFADGLSPHDLVLYAFGRYVIHKDEDVYKVVRHVD